MFLGLIVGKGSLLQSIEAFLWFLPKLETKDACSSGTVLSTMVRARSTKGAARLLLRPNAK